MAHGGQNQPGFRSGNGLVRHEIHAPAQRVLQQLVQGEEIVVSPFILVKFDVNLHVAVAVRLAKQGLRYNQFHTTALCSPTRRALLSGRNHHINNMGSITETAMAFPGNTGQRPNNVAPLAEMLRLNGYSTSFFGKNHETAPWEVSPSGPTDRWPTRSGFDMKASMPMERLTGDPFCFLGFGCGALLARAHCRNGDGARLDGYCGKSEVLDEALAEFAESYGDQTETDHASLLEAIKQGPMKSLEGA